MKIKILRDTRSNEEVLREAMLKVMQERELSINKVCRGSGVSYMTVKRFLNDDGPIDYLTFFKFCNFIDNINRERDGSAKGLFD